MGFFYGEGSKNVSASGASGKVFAKKTLSGFGKTGFFEEKFRSRVGVVENHSPTRKGGGRASFGGGSQKSALNAYVNGKMYASIKCQCCVRVRMRVWKRTCIKHCDARVCAFACIRARMYMLFTFAASNVRVWYNYAPTLTLSVARLCGHV